MRGPDTATITTSLERSLQNCSLNDAAEGGVAGFTSSSSSDLPEICRPHSTDAGLDLNLQNSLPCHWEQCLDLQTGEVYYINWRTGLRAKDDPRTSGDFDTEDEDEDDDVVDDDDVDDDDVLVVVGCKGCLMYFMVPKQDSVCPKCYRQLLHFDQSDRTYV